MILIDDGFTELPCFLVEFVSGAVGELDARWWQCICGVAERWTCADGERLKARFEILLAVLEDGTNLVRIALMPSQFEMLKEVLK